MSNRRTRKAVVYTCDNPRCKRKHTAPFNDYRLAWANAKEAGWKTVKVLDKWFHFCSWVHIPSDTDLKALALGNNPVDAKLAHDLSGKV